MLVPETEDPHTVVCTQFECAESEYGCCQALTWVLPVQNGRKQNGCNLVIFINRSMFVYIRNLKKNGLRIDVGRKRLCIVKHIVKDKSSLNMAYNYGLNVASASLKEWWLANYGLWQFVSQYHCLRKEAADVARVECLDLSQPHNVTSRSGWRWLEIGVAGMSTRWFTMSDIMMRRY